MAKTKKDSIVEIAVEAAKEVVETVKEAAKEVAKELVEENETIDAKIPEGPLAEKWTNYKAHQKLVNPANKRKLDVIVVGTGLAGASAAASLAEMGFNVLNFCIQDSPRRAHSIAAQGGINAAKTIKTTVTQYIVYSMILSKVVTIVLVKPTFTV